jgi:hypothetical protein
MRIEAASCVEELTKGRSNGESMKKTDKNDNDPDNDNVTASRKRIPKKKPLKNTTEQKRIQKHLRIR